MPKLTPELHLLYGLPGSGKSTLARSLGSAPSCITVSEDSWLSALFSEEMTDLSDYQRYAARLHSAMAPHVTGLLGAGLSVVLDFPANTPETRASWRKVATTARVPVRLHHLATPRATCLSRIRARDSDGSHPFTLSEDQFARLCNHITPPHPDEGFQIITHHPQSYRD